MQLDQVPVGQSATISDLGGPRDFKRRLMELGLIPGTPIVVVAIAPLGDPLKLQVRGCALSIRRSEAACIGVQLMARAAKVPDRAVVAAEAGA